VTPILGSRYKKVMYFEYTDDTFTIRKPKPAHLGVLGPIIQGEVGKQISVSNFLFGGEKVSVKFVSELNFQISITVLYSLTDLEKRKV